jgi:uncharacterized coiled-coil protein SlyX
MGSSVRGLSDRRRYDKVKIVNGKETLVAVPEKTLQELNSSLETLERHLNELQEKVANLIKNGELKAKPVEPKTEFVAEYNEKANGFLCLLCGTKAVYGAPQIVAHLQVKHKIAPDAQHIDGWSKDDEAEYQKSLSPTTRGQQRSNGKGD